MSNEDRTTEAVYAVIQELFNSGKTSIRPGDVAEVMRERDAPMPVWQLRAEFTKMEGDGRLSCDEDTGNWHLNENVSLKDISLKDAG